MFNPQIAKSYVDFLRTASLKKAGSSVLCNVEKAFTPDLARLYYGLSNVADDRVDHTRIYVSKDPAIDSRTDSIANMVHIEKALPEALKLISIVWPEYYGLIINTIERISPPPVNTTYESLSDPKAFGQIYYNMGISSPIKIAEILVHETAHHYLFVLSAKYRWNTIVDWSQPGFSEIRQSVRPLIGIFHGVFAEACMFEYYDRIIKKTGSVDLETNNWAIERRKWAGNLAIKDSLELEKFEVIHETMDVVSKYIQSQAKLAKTI